MLTCSYCAYLRKCIEKAYKEGYEHNPDFEGEAGCPNFGFKRNTNADRIRAMSDGQLAHLMVERNVNESTLLLLNKDHALTATQIEALKHRIYCDCMQWLKQPAQEEL